MLAYKDSPQEFNQPHVADLNKISALIDDLNNSDGVVRHQARTALVQIGEPAVDSLIQALRSRNGYTYWEATKALSYIGSSKTIQTFIDLLEDRDFSIRWLAAEGLTTIGRPVVIPLLKTLEQQADSIWLREGVYHVFHDLISRKLINISVRVQLEPVLAAWHDMEPAITLPVAAWKAHQALINN